MKNITLRLDEDRLNKARKIAADQSTSVNALIRKFLDELIAQESRAEIARRELVSLCEKSTAASGDSSWTRESLYDR